MSSRRITHNNNNAGGVPARTRTRCERTLAGQAADDAVAVRPAGASSGQGEDHRRRRAGRCSPAAAVDAALSASSCSDCALSRSDRADPSLAIQRRRHSICIRHPVDACQ